MKKTKIVCTLGPASETGEVFKQLVSNGLNVVRLNFSHGSYEEHGKRIDMIKKVREEMSLPIGILLDTKGPEIRTRAFSSPEVKLEEGQLFTLTNRDIIGDETICSVSYKGLPKDVKPGDTILIDDGLVALEVLEVKYGSDILCTVKNSGTVKDHKGINVPSVHINLPGITQKDREDIEFGIRKGIDFIAVSFVRRASDVLAIRETLEENNGGNIRIISKIENREGMDHLDEIIAVSDGVMVARGDLGVEIPAEEIPLAQKSIIKKCNKVGKPVITATQMLDSMIRNPRPTRAEVTDVANAIFDGTDAIMLSGETAAGKYPVESVKTMSLIAKSTESAIDYHKQLHNSAVEKEASITDAISHATCNIAMDLGASAIITATSSGYTARMVSKFRPAQPIVAATSNEEIRRRLSLSWGVYSILNPSSGSTDDIVKNSVAQALNYGYIRPGELVVITAGVPVGVAGTTNLIKAHIVGEVLVTGTGIGEKSVTGTARIIRENSDSIVFNEGDILVAQKTGEELLPLMYKAGAIITEVGGSTSHAALTGLAIKRTTVIGAKGALNKLNDGDKITVDGASGQVYKG
ncbi:MAG: pyruvate kinase [Eubacteriales bacterium]|nr:pyruvate kinase [Eubacteriales bacterium]